MKDYDKMTYEEKLKDSVYSHNYICADCKKDIYNENRHDVAGYKKVCDACYFVRIEKENEIMTDLLTGLLNCGYRDLDNIMDCKYDMEDLIEEVKNSGDESIDINNLTYAMFEKGKEEIRTSIENRIEEIEEEINNTEDKKEIKNLKKELKEIKNLDPYEDIGSFHNYCDTSIYFNEDKGDIYKKYFQEALDEFYENTGFNID